MDVRYQVFISSTFTDLKAERQAVLTALLQLNAVPSGMELFPAADEDAWTLISRVIDECDYYLLLIGGRYGSVDADGLSFTEREYDYAVSRSKPVMAFLHGKPDDIPIGKSEKEPDARKRLEKFRAKVEKAKHVKYWTTADGLQGQVAFTFASFVKSYPATGWIRADQVASPDALAEINALRKEKDSLVEKLDRSRTEPPAGTERLARGTESYAIYFEARFRIEGDAPTKKDEEPPSRHQTYPFECDPTWDEIVEAIGPILFDEASEERMRKTLSDWILRNYEGDFDQQVIDWIKRGGYTYSGAGGEDYSGLISTEQFSTILVQLKALGIVEKSTRSRSVKDTNTYWKLTPYGDTYVTNLIAIQSGDTEAPPPSASEAPVVAPST